jgi:hypothetical protein
VLAGVPVQNPVFYGLAVLQQRDNKTYPMVRISDTEGQWISPQDTQGLMFYHRIISQRNEPISGKGADDYHICYYSMRLVAIGYRPNITTGADWNNEDQARYAQKVISESGRLSGSEIMMVQGQTVTDKVAVLNTEFAGHNMKHLALDLVAYSVEYIIKQRVISAGVAPDPPSPLVSFQYTNNGQGPIEGANFVTMVPEVSPAGGDRSYKLDANDTLPAGLSLNETTGIITRTGTIPDGSYSFDVILVVTGAVLGVAAVNVTLEVQVAPSGVSVVLSGSADGSMESEIVAGGNTIICTMSGSTWAATIGDDNAITSAFIAGIVGSQSAGLIASATIYTNVVRTSDTVVTITLPAVAGYTLPSGQDDITISVPASAVVSGDAVSSTAVSVKQPVQYHGVDFPARSKALTLYVNSQIGGDQFIDDVSYYLGFYLGKSSGDPLKVVYSDGTVQTYAVNTYPSTSTDLHRVYAKPLDIIYIVSTDDWQDFHRFQTRSSSFYDNFHKQAPDFGDCLQLETIIWNRNNQIGGWENEEGLYNCPIKDIRLNNSGSVWPTFMPDDRMAQNWDLERFETDAVNVYGVISVAGWGGMTNFTYWRTRNAQNSQLFYEKGAFANMPNLSYLEFQRNTFPAASMDDIIQDIDDSGSTNGTLILTNLNGQSPTSDAYDAYNNLITKGWTITGVTPPSPP